jgi:hypothetical protein
MTAPTLRGIGSQSAVILTDGLCGEPRFAGQARRTLAILAQHPADAPGRR